MLGLETLRPRETTPHIKSRKTLYITQEATSHNVAFLKV